MTTVDYGDATITPGLVDAHTHLASPGDGTPGEGVAAMGDELLLLQSAWTARIFLHDGVTTIRENGNKGRVVFQLREAIRRGFAAGPALSVTGRPLAITGGHLWYFGSEVDGEDACRTEVRKLIKEGADWIKMTSSGGSTLSSFPLRPSFSQAELSAIVDEAHRFGKLTGAHCTATRAIEQCLNAGVDMLIHCNFNEPDGSASYRADLIDRATEQGAWINPTIHGWQTEHDGLVIRRDRGDRLTPAEERDLVELPGKVEQLCELVSRMVRQGARVIAGSDMPWRWGVARFGLANEIGWLARSGMTNLEALTAGMSRSAESIGNGDRAGTLATGRPGDVAVFDGDPVADLGALKRVRDVYQAGRRVARGA